MQVKIQKLKTKDKNIKRGFSLVETLVAITILLTAIAAPMTIAQKGLSSAQLVKNQITASFLAQEALEFIKNIRDTNIISGLDWETGLGECLVSGDSCVVDIPNETLERCNGSCPFLKYDSDSGFYGQDAFWTNSIFTRSVEITTLSDTEITVKSTVSWLEHGKPKDITLSINLLDWSEN